MSETTTQKARKAYGIKVDRTIVLRVPSKPERVQVKTKGGHLQIALATEQGPVYVSATVSDKYDWPGEVREQYKHVVHNAETVESLSGSGEEYFPATLTEGEAGRFRVDVKGPGGLFVWPGVEVRVDGTVKLSDPYTHTDEDGDITPDDLGEGV